MRKAGWITLKRALHVHGEDLVPVLFRDVVEGAVAQDAGVGDDDVDLAEGVERGLDDRLAAFVGVDAVGVGDGFAAGGLDLVDDLVGHLAAGRCLRRRGRRRGR